MRTRNARLAAIRSFFRYAALRHPEHAGLIARVLGHPNQAPGTKGGLLPDRSRGRGLGRPPGPEDLDRQAGPRPAGVAVQTGLRVSELTGLRNQDVELGTGAHVRCVGKGRKERCTPLDPVSASPLCGSGCKSAAADPTTRCSRPGGAARSPRRRRAPGHQARRHRRTALPIPADQAPDATHPEAQLRHGSARAGVDRTVIALWLGHEGRDNGQLPPCRHVHQGASPRPRTTPRQTRPLPRRPAARLPRQPPIPGIMPPRTGRTSLPARAPPDPPHIIRRRA